jgi:hypothetical protein
LARDVQRSRGRGGCGAVTLAGARRRAGRATAGRVARRPRPGRGRCGPRLSAALGRLDAASRSSHRRAQVVALRVG